MNILRQNKQQIQCFLHYVNANGPYKEFKYDKRPMMGLVKPYMTKLIRPKITFDYV